MLKLETLKRLAHDNGGAILVDFAFIGALVVGAAIVALVLADALLEKLGGDSMRELLAHWQETKRLQAEWPGSFGDAVG